MVKNHTPQIPEQNIITILKNSKGGMWSHKSEGISYFQQQWLSDPNIFKPDMSNWQSWRDDLAARLKQIGMAKTSFAIEMLYPTQANLICIDRHMFKAFGWHRVDDTASVRQYRYYEDYWLDLSQEYNIPPVIARNIYWDKILN